MNPKIFFVIGPAGAGKSHIARLLAQRHEATCLDKDSIANRLTGLALELAGHRPDERDGNELYRSRILPLEYDTLLAVAGDNLRLGRSVVLDAPFGSFFGDPDYVLDAAERHFWPPSATYVVHVSVTEAEQRRRLVERGLARDEWKLAHWDEFWAGATATTCAWRGARHVEFDNTPERIDPRTLDEVIDGA